LALEEVVCAFHQRKLFCLRYRSNQIFELGQRTVLVARPTDEELGLDTLAQEIIGIQPASCFDWNPKCNHACDSLVRTSSAQSNRSTEGEAGKDDRETKFTF